MKVLFVYPVVPPNYDTFGIQQGIAAISAVLKEGGHDTRLYSDYEFRPAALDEVVESFRPGLVGIHATYPQSDLVLQIAEHLGARHSLKVIIGGVWPTTQGDEAIASPHITGMREERPSTRCSTWRMRWNAMSPAGTSPVSGSGETAR